MNRQRFFLVALWLLLGTTAKSLSAQTVVGCPTCVDDIDLWMHHFDLNSYGLVGYSPDPAHTAWWRNYCWNAHSLTCGFYQALSKEDADYLRQLPHTHIVDVARLVHLMRTYPEVLLISASGTSLEVRNCVGEASEIPLSPEFAEALLSALAADSQSS